jgi:hypothetical protein
VHVVGCVWVLVTMSYRVIHLMSLLLEDSTLANLLGIERPPGHDCQGSRYVPSRVTQRIYSLQIGGEIQPIRGYRDRRGGGPIQIIPVSSSFLGWWPILFSPEWWDHV